MERLTKRDKDGNLCAVVHDYIRYAKKLAEYEDLEEQGLLLKLPCKVGDVIYVLTNDSPTGIERTVCERISVTKKGVLVQAKCQYDDWGNAKWNLKSKDFGKTVLLTQAEAEEALKRMEEENETD